MYQKKQNTQCLKALLAIFANPLSNEDFHFFEEMKKQNIRVFLIEPLPALKTSAIRAQALKNFMLQHQLDAGSVIVLADRDSVLEAARTCGAASAGYLRPEGPDLIASPYLFQSFCDDELPDYLEKAYCRFHSLPWQIAATPRLIIRETIPEDLPALRAAYQGTDPGQVRFFPEPVSTSCFTPEKDQIFLKEYSRVMYSLYGFGLYTVIHRPSGTLAAHCGFSFDEKGIPSLGYLTVPQFRRQEIALEASLACLTWFRDNSDYSHVLCRTCPDNLPARKLAEKLAVQWPGAKFTETRVLLLPT